MGTSFRNSNDKGNRMAATSSKRKGGSSWRSRNGSRSQPIGEGLELARRENRSGLQERPQRGRRYRNVAVEKQLTGETRGAEKVLNDKPQPRTGGAENA